MEYSIKNIADFCDVDLGFVRRIVDSNEIRPTKSYKRLKLYTFYQLYILHQLLEQLLQRQIFLDFENEEVFTVYESSMNEETHFS